MENNGTRSARLEEIISLRESAATMQAVFFDIEKFSKRRTRSQKTVIDAFTETIRTSLNTIAAQYVQYSQSNGYNFSTDVIRIPTGDGAAICFTFDGLHDVHLKFALTVLKHAAGLAKENPCETFDRDNWCNCHANFNLRIGIAEGKTIVYRDINHNYNAAGNALNMASRVMNLVDPNQIALTRQAYEQIVDMVDDPMIADRFEAFESIPIKHGELISLYQYRDHSLDFLNCEIPGRVKTAILLNKAQSGMTEAMAGLSLNSSGSLNASMETLAKLMKVAQDVKDAATYTDQTRHAVINSPVDRPAIDIKDLES